MAETKHSLLGIYRYQDDLIDAVQSLKSSDIEIDTVFTPARNEQVNEAVGAKPSLLRWIVLAGGTLGVISGFGLSIFTVLQWGFVVSGKPVVPITPFVIEGFEFCILFSAISAFFGILLLSRLPKRRLPAYYDPRFSIDHFGLVAIVPEVQRERVVDLLRQSGAEEIRDVER